MYVSRPPIFSKDPAGVPVCLTAVQQSLVHAPLRGVSLAVDAVDIVGREDQVVVCASGTIAAESMGCAKDVIEDVLI